jgi:hypothetical protein
MDPLLRRYYLSAAVILLATIAASIWWRSPRVTFGAAAGVLVSVLPFATWHLIVERAAPGRGRRWGLVVVLVAAKYALAAAALWALLQSGTAEPTAVAAGVVAGSVAILPVAFIGSRG